MRVAQRLHGATMLLAERLHGAQMQVTECLHGTQMRVTERLRGAQQRVTQCLHPRLSQRTSQPHQRPPNDPLTLKTMKLLRDNNGRQASWFMECVWGLRVRLGFALRSPQRHPLVTLQKGDRTCPSHFLSCSEERAAWILDTIDPTLRPLVKSCPHLHIQPAGPLFASDAE